MKIFLAGSGYHPYLVDEFTNFYRLESFYYLSKKEIPFIGKYKSFLLDSGAFSFIKNGGNDIDWDKYIDTYASFINQHDVKHFFELDIDVIVGLEKVEQMRARLEDLTGKQCIPVWHKSRGKDYWLKLIQEYSYVAIGGIAIKTIKRDEYKYFTWFLNEARKHNCNVHGLGFTNLKGLEKYPFYSVDSTSWLSGNQFGAVYKFNGQTMEKYDKPTGKRVKTKEVAHHNFYEWVKFQQYADQNL